MKLFESKVLICVGSGGVGKTTVAAALGIRAAEQGLKVLVLTIDPSMRLAQALGIDGGGDLVKVPGQAFKGELWASVVHHQKVFDDFVRRAAKKSPAVEKILQNKLYQQMSTTLGGSQEFTCLEKLYNCFESGQFDLIILDTPPSQHAIDFLKAPIKLGALFKKSITQWFQKPNSEGVGFIQSLLNSGTRQVVKALELLTGSEFIRELADFFTSVNDWQEDLESQILKVQSILSGPQTQFVIVTSFNEAKLIEAENLILQLESNHYKVGGLVLNRTFPDWLGLPKESESANLAVGTVSELERLTILFKNYYQSRSAAYKAFENRISRDIPIYKIPDYIQNPSDVRALEKLSKDFVL